MIHASRARRTSCSASLRVHEVDKESKLLDKRLAVVTGVAYGLARRLVLRQGLWRDSVSWYTRDDFRDIWTVAEMLDTCAEAREMRNREVRSGIWRRYCWSTVFAAKRIGERCEY